MPARRRSALPRRLQPRDASPQHEVLDELRRVIVEGGVPPGSPVPVGEVAAVLGVSPIPVRESLRQLIGEGLVEHRANVGFTVAQLTLAELSDIYAARVSLEDAAFTAAVRYATDADDDTARAAYAALDEAIDDDTNYHLYSREFHLSLVRPSRMGRLLHMLESAWNTTEPARPMSALPHAERVELHRDHAEMLDAFINRDCAALRAISVRHLGSLRSAIIEFPPEPGLRPAD